MQVGEGCRPRIRLPITSAVLLRLREAWEDSAYAHDSIMLRAACNICFFGFLRSGEITVSGTDKWDAVGTLMLEDVALERELCKGSEGCAVEGWCCELRIVRP